MQRKGKMPDRVCVSCGRFSAVTVRKVQRKELAWWDACTDCLALVTDWFDDGKKPEDYNSDDSEAQAEAEQQNTDADSGELGTHIRKRSCQLLDRETFRSSGKGPTANRKV